MLYKYTERGTMESRAKFQDDHRHVATWSSPQVAGSIQRD